MLECQRLLLGDHIRNEAFAQALKSVIKPGKTIVADIGSGTGYLSFLAEQLGAKHCHLYEVSDDMLGLSKRLAKANGMKRCTFIAAHSTSVKTPVKADVVISETLGNFAYEENIIETMNDARRFLKKGGIMIPQSLRQFVAPVIDSRLYDELNVWERVGNRLDFTDAKSICMNNMYVKEVNTKDLLGKTSAAQWDSIDLREKNASVRKGEALWRPDSVMTVYGFAVWWECTLLKDIVISTSPWKPMTHWKQIYLPVMQPLTVRPSETLQLRINSDSRPEVKINVAWDVMVIGKNGKARETQRMNMRKGYILAQ